MKTKKIIILSILAALPLSALAKGGEGVSSPAANSRTLETPTAKDTTENTTRCSRLTTAAGAKPAGINASKLESALSQYRMLHAKLMTDFSVYRQAQSSTVEQCLDKNKLRAALSSQQVARQLIVQDQVKLRQLRVATQSTAIVPLLRQTAGVKS